MLDRAQEKAVLVHILYLHKKTRLLNIILCTGYEYFKDSSVLYLDISCFNLIVAFSNMKYNNKKKKMEKSELSQSVENHENVSVML